MSEEPGMLDRPLGRIKDPEVHQSQCVTALRALVEVLEIGGSPLFAHTVRRGANRMVRLEATILRQNRQLLRYRAAANMLKQLGDGI